MPHFYGAVGAPNVGHHRWQPYSRRPLVVGSAYQKHLVRLFLQELREGDPAPEWGLRVTAGVLAVLVHALMLFLLLLSRPMGFLPPPTGHEPVAAVQVRLIENPQPPPPPPPVTLPKRQARSAPPVARQAPVAAMPAVPAPAPIHPQVTVTPSRPEIAQTPTLVVVPEVAAPLPPVAASPPAPPPPVPVLEASAPPKVVLEVSNMAVPPPQVQELEVTPAQVPSTRLQPVPARQEAPQVTLGRTDLEVSDTEPAPVPVPMLRAMAPLPDITVTPTAKPEPNVPEASVPTVVVATPTPPAVQMPQVRAVAPAPAVQIPSVNATPALNLPVADVPAAQAPQVQAPQVRVRMPSAAVAVASPTSAPAAVASVVAASTARVAPSTSSWAPANDQFKPLSGKQEVAGRSAGETGGDHTRQAQGYVQLPPRGNSDVMTRSSDRLGYKSTIFEQYWAPANESILDTFLRHFIEKLTVRHTFHLAPGVRVHCVLGPLAVFLGCGGDPPRPESDKSGDSRLNMAPARPLAPGLGAPAPAAPASPLQLDNQAACDAARVAGSPPPPGCPGAPVKPSQSDQWYPPGGGK